MYEKSMGGKKNHQNIGKKNTKPMYTLQRKNFFLIQKIHHIIVP